MRQKRLHSELRYKRLEAGTYQFPFAETGRKEIAAWELGLLREGIDLSKGKRRKRYSLPETCASTLEDAGVTAEE